VELGLVDIRRDSPTFRNSVQFEWSDKDDVAIVVPKGVAHVVNFLDDSVLAFGLSAYWTEEFDVIGCQWDDPDLGFKWNNIETMRSCRDTQAGSFNQMISDYERLSAQLESGLIALG
jgi:dTDP-4-dehydrorhamnose 3,5-epimerase